MGFCYEDKIKDRKNEELNYNKKDKNKKKIILMKILSKKFLKTIHLKILRKMILI